LYMYGPGNGAPIYSVFSEFLIAILTFLASCYSRIAAGHLTNDVMSARRK
jgi:hypothetical protein